MTTEDDFFVCVNTILVWIQGNSIQLAYGLKASSCDPLIHHLLFENNLIWMDSFRHLKGYIVPHLISMKIQIWK